ncbi:P-loop ATPase, Sll1717 family [Marisediminicola senii]|uniref:P-loop ATPase, Sll1717 family n=1 Tax=Marisediminicola senii TaxID=2711233 RepID=UPI0013EDC2B9|nr:hypothetical protein [Marisediminicola senii]
MSLIASPSIFFAYAGQPSLRAETMRETISSLSSRGAVTLGWQELAVEGKLLIDTICDAIDSSSAVVAEVSDLNSNVIFEAGFALGRNKVLWLALDETDETATKSWNDLSILSTLGRIDYGGDSERLVSRVLTISPQLSEPTLLDSLLAGARPREANAVFAPPLPIRINASRGLEKMLERQSHLKLVGAGDELGLAPIHWQIQEIYRSSAAIIHLLGPHRNRAREHNARSSFLAGVARGLGLPLLMVVEHGFIAPLDYKDSLFVYSTAAALQEHVSQWLDRLPKPDGSNKRLGRLALDVELPIRDFGQFVAENEVQELNNYFIETNEFQSILEGSASVFVGRKGTGKTATMSQAVLELRKDRRNLVVPIKPTSYELSGLLDVLRSFKSESNTEYLLVNLWTYLIYTEVAIRAVVHARERPAGIGELTPMRELELELEGLGVDVTADLATRLEAAVAALSNGIAMEDEKQYIADQLRLQRLGKLRSLIGTALHDFDRIAVLIDNLDKTWERGADYALMSKFILALLTTSGKIEKDFAKGSSASPAINVTLSVFLRTDIFDVVADHAREPDKIGALSVHWQDEELLVRVLEERYGVKRLKKKHQAPSNLWHEVFDSEVKGTPTRDYLLWRTLPRPRDFIYFANAALTTAINRKHSIIQESDVLFAEGQYSKFAFDALLVESEAQGFDLESVLFEFPGLPSTLSSEDLDDVIRGSGSDVDVRSWLIRTSFLGLEIDEGAFVHIEGETAAKRKAKVAERLARRLGRPMRYRIHPAFRKYLDVQDDDLHIPDIRDQTLLKNLSPDVGSSR